MNTEDMKEIIEKLVYHVSLLGETIDHRTHPVESLIVGMNWSREDVDKAHDIFEHWDRKLENGEKMSAGEFENDFKRELGLSYQALKSVILAFYQNYQWTNVCEAYVDTFGATPAIEYHSIMKRER